MKAGIIGLGHGSRVLIDSFRLSKIEILGVASKNYSKAKKISKEKNIKKTYKNWKLLIKDKNIDIIAVAVPPIFQIKILKDCLIENKIILCEKPIGINMSSINDFFLLLKNYKKAFLVNYIFAEHEAFKKFKKIIDKKEKLENDVIEVIFNTQTYVNKNRIVNWKLDLKKGGGLINLFLSHIIDYMIIFFGKINKINANIVKNKLFCVLEFKSKIKANIFIDSNNPKQRHVIKYNSKKFQLILDNETNDYCKNFILKNIEKNKNNKKIYTKIKYKDNIKKYKQDSRILMSSTIINKLLKKNNKLSRKDNLNRFLYNEYILNCSRISNEKKKNIIINA